MNPDDDDDIRNAFRDLRASDAQQAPSFDDLVGELPRRRQRSWFLAAAAAAAAAVLVAAILNFAKTPNDSPSERPIVSSAQLPFDEWSQLIADTTDFSAGTSSLSHSTTGFLLDIPPAQP